MTVAYVYLNKPHRMQMGLPEQAALAAAICRQKRYSIAYWFTDPLDVENHQYFYRTHGFDWMVEHLSRHDDVRAIVSYSLHVLAPTLWQKRQLAGLGREVALARSGRVLLPSELSDIARCDANRRRVGPSSGSAPAAKA